MSSNLKIVKICAFYKQEFIAKKTTETCSDPCAKRLYKLRLREQAIGRAKLETEARRKPEAFITEVHPFSLIDSQPPTVIIR
jgi:hypothetical protein